MDAPFRVTQQRGVSAARDADGRKQCRDCRRWLPESAFSRHLRTTDGLRAHCRACNVTSRIRYEYGLTQSAFAEMLASQDHRCAICQTDDPGRWWCIDHDHSCCATRPTCGKCLRGILCDSCNNGLSRFADSPSTLRRAADYLERCASS